MKAAAEVRRDGRTLFERGGVGKGVRLGRECWTSPWRDAVARGGGCRKMVLCRDVRALAVLALAVQYANMSIMSSMFRTTWANNFPDVVVHTTVKTRDAHACYQRAKSGDAEAALSLALELLSAAAVEALRDLIASRDIVLLPVVADESLGFNAIPDALALVLGRELGASVASGEIVQTNKVGHTRAPSFQRLVTPAQFEGPVDREQCYVLVDDHVGLGGTLANLRGHVCLNGGMVIGMTTLTESRAARTISLQHGTRTLLWEKHGEALNTFWQDQFGYGIDCLTDVEAQNLCRQPTVAAIEDFLAQAAVEARSRGLYPALS